MSAPNVRGSARITLGIANHNSVRLGGPPDALSPCDGPQDNRVLTSIGSITRLNLKISLS